MVSKILAGAPRPSRYNMRIEVGAVHDDFGTRQRVQQRRQVEVGQRIDEFIGVRKPDLHQTDSLAVTVQAVGLGVDAVDGDAPLCHLRAVRSLIPAAAAPAASEGWRACSGDRSRAVSHHSGSANAQKPSLDAIATYCRPPTM